MNLLEDVLATAPEITRIRRDIHAHPELCFEEHRTADVVAERLQAWGIEVHRGLAGTGVIGVIRGNDAGASGRAIGLRADMDALPVQEKNKFAHASQHPGKMHACGHDGHTAMLLAGARYLAAHRDFDGTVYVIFQPAEEDGGGARVMLEEGLLHKFPMQAVFGMHNWPGLPAGTFAVSPGPVMASSNDFRVLIRGKGAHAALPHNGIDPIVVACQMIQAFQTIISRNRKPIDGGVISVTMIHAGNATNVIPDSCELQGTVRTFEPALLDLIEARMTQVAHQTAAVFGAACEFEFRRKYPATINDRAAALFVRSVLEDWVGPERARAQEPSMTAEDFGFMLQALPGAYIFIGNGEGEHRGSGHGEGPCMLHNPSYDFNDELIPVGGTFWAHLARRWLSAPR
jgi:amidohydrolase